MPPELTAPRHPAGLGENRRRRRQKQRRHPAEPRDRLPRESEERERSPAEEPGWELRGAAARSRRQRALRITGHPSSPPAHPA